MMFKALFILILLFSFNGVKAQTAELELTMHFAGVDDGLITGQRRTFELTVTNHGPDDANPTGDDFFFVASSNIPSNDIWIPDIVFELDIENSPAECVLSIFFGDPLPGQNPNYGFAFLLIQLEAGESITCRGFYTPYFTEGERTVTWQMINNLAVDPDLSNNEVTVTFGLRPVSVPINSIWALSCLIILLLISVQVKRFR